MPEGVFMIVNEPGLADLMREMNIPLDQLFSPHPNYDQAALGREIIEQKLAVLVSNV